MTLRARSVNRSYICLSRNPAGVPQTHFASRAVAQFSKHARGLVDSEQTGKQKLGLPHFYTRVHLEVFKIPLTAKLSTWRIVRPSSSSLPSSQTVRHTKRNSVAANRTEITAARRIPVINRLNWILSVLQILGDRSAGDSQRSPTISVAATLIARPRPELSNL